MKQAARNAKTKISSSKKKRKKTSIDKNDVAMRSFIEHWTERFVVDPFKGSIIEDEIQKGFIAWKRKLRK
jgi:hypothetical protein